MLKTGIILHPTWGRPIITALHRIPQLDLCAVAMTGGESEAAALTDVKPIQQYSDPRALVIREELDLLILALPPTLAHSWLEKIIACGRPVNLWSAWPPFWDWATSQRVVELLNGHVHPLIIHQFWRNEQAYEVWPSHLDKIGLLNLHLQIHTPADQFILESEPNCSLDHMIWIVSAYAWLEYLIEKLGPISQILVQASHLPKPVPIHTAAYSALVRTSTGVAGVISILHHQGAASYQLELQGLAGRIEINHLGSEYTAPDQDKIMLQRVTTDDYLQSLNWAVSEFSRRPQEPTHFLGSHLETMATIEAAVLSLKTQQFERPPQIRQVRKL
ncbi:MAG: hypothetical protein HJJLKODD_02182 [Phycisphaerae bacterium]|nr:hypothetical protein [Phycisphaerae bacterium]